MSILNPCLDENVHTYAKTKEMITMPFRINIENIGQAFGMQVTFVAKIKPQKQHFLAKRKHSFF